MTTSIRSIYIIQINKKTGVCETIFTRHFTSVELRMVQMCLKQNYSKPPEGKELASYFTNKFQKNMEQSNNDSGYSFRNDDNNELQYQYQYQQQQQQYQQQNPVMELLFNLNSQEAHPKNNNNTNTNNNNNNNNNNDNNDSINNNNNNNNNNNEAKILPYIFCIQRSSHQYIWPLILGEEFTLTVDGGESLSHCRLVILPMLEQQFLLPGDKIFNLNLLQIPQITFAMYLLDDLKKAILMGNNWLFQPNSSNTTNNNMKKEMEKKEGAKLLDSTAEGNKTNTDSKTERKNGYI